MTPLVAGMEDLFNSAHMFRYSRNYSLPLHGAPYNAQSYRWGMQVAISKAFF